MSNYISAYATHVVPDVSSRATRQETIKLGADYCLLYKTKIGNALLLAKHFNQLYSKRQSRISKKAVTYFKIIITTTISNCVEQQVLILLFGIFYCPF